MPSKGAEEESSVREFLRALFLDNPAYAENLFVVLGGVDRHGHVVVRGYYLDGGQQMPWEQKKGALTSWKSSLKRRFNNSAYLWNKVSCRLFIMEIE
jgi:hypothetical protein